MTEQEQENAQYLQAHVETVAQGLDALMDLLHGLPAGHQVQASSMRTLLQPLASEAQQALPLAALLVGAASGAFPLQ